jgi:hypothetical protein
MSRDLGTCELITLQTFTIQDLAQLAWDTLLAIEANETVSEDVKNALRTQIDKLKNGGWRP